MNEDYFPTATIRAEIANGITLHFAVCKYSADLIVVYNVYIPAD